MRVLPFLMVLFVCTSASAQVVAPPPPVGVSPDTAGAATDILFAKVEVMASYPGGLQAWGRYLSNEFNRRKLGKKALDQGISPGRHKAVLRFIVEPNGAVTNVVVLQAIGYGVDEELSRIFAASRKWRAGSQNGKKVRSYHTQPFEFIIEK